MAELSFDPEEHKYFLDGKELISVTRVLALAGLTNLFNRDEAAALRGRYVHQACCLLDEDNLDFETLDPVLVPYIMAYQKFKDDYPHKVIEKELKVFSATYQFAGTLDRIIGIEDRLAILDIKTGTPDLATALQIAGYQICWEEMTAKRISKRFGLHLKNDKNYSLVEYKNKQDKNVFLAALAMCRWRENNRRG